MRGSKGHKIDMEAYQPKHTCNPTKIVQTETFPIVQTNQQDIEKSTGEKNFRSITLFSQTALETAEKLKYHHPVEANKYVTIWVKNCLSQRTV